jgi:glutamyl-tRNA reductase
VPLQRTDHGGAVRTATVHTETVHTATVHTAVQDDPVPAGSTAVALRRRAAETVADELRRLQSRVPSTDEKVHLEVAQTVQRVVEALLGAPLARLEHLEGTPGERASLRAMRALLGIDNI